MEETSEIRAAATVILLRDDSDGLYTLLLRRSSALGFAGGAWVFPGGRVDPQEIAGSDSALDAARLAAVRETHEEAELVIDAADLDYYAHWTTPPGMSRRYATWFFVARAPDEHAVTVDGSEIHDHQWVRPSDALLMHARREIQMMAPTFVSLTEISACASVADVRSRVAARGVPMFEPHFVARPELPAESLYFGDAGYESSNPDVPGPRHRMVMGRGEWRYLNDGVLVW